MVVCGRPWISVRLEEVFINSWDKSITQLNDAEHADLLRHDSKAMVCGAKYHLYTKPKGDEYGYIICKDCALKAGFVW